LQQIVNILNIFSSLLLLLMYLFIVPVLLIYFILMKIYPKILVKNKYFARDKKSMNLIEIILSENNFLWRLILIKINSD